MESMELLQEKLDELLRRQRTLKKELAEARNLIARTEAEAEGLRTKLEASERQNTALALSQALPDAESRSLARERLDNVIADIDKLLSSLHE